MNFSFAYIDLTWLLPEHIFGWQVLERTPAALSLVFVVGVGVILALLLVSAIGDLRPRTFVYEARLPRAVLKRLSRSVANRSLSVWQVVFALAAVSVFGFQAYWALFADDSNTEYQALAYKDLRTRRTGAATLRGWMLDRTGRLDSALAGYKLGKDGAVERYYPLEREMAHLLGTERGSPGLERTLYKKADDPMPEAWDVLFKYKKPEPQDRDVRTTISRDLQMFAAQQLSSKHGAIVVLEPQTGDVLALYSNPTFSLAEVQDLGTYLKLEADKADKPLLNRALREYYVPGSTFKTFTMISAFRAGKPDLLFDDLPNSADPPCYTPFRGSRPICDAGGSCDLCRPQVNIRDAFRVSSNQYFAQLGNALGRERMAESARQFGIATPDRREDALTQGLFSEIWNTSDPRIANSLALARSTMVVGKDLSLYDFGLIGMGQGLASQMTPFQLALIAAAAGNKKGQLMRPKIELDIEPKPYSQILTPQQAAIVREIMSTVTEEPGGTGGRVKAILAGTGIATGGKTGTAEKDGVPMFDKRTGEPIYDVIRQRAADGSITETKRQRRFDRTDGWFICIAPIDDPRIAVAVVIEDIKGQFGGDTAAPVAARMVLKSRDLGLLGDKYRPRPAAAVPAKKSRR